MWWLNPCALNIEVDVFLRDGPSGSVASNYINLEIFTIILLILRRYLTPRSPLRPAPHATCSLTEPSRPSPSTSSMGTLTSSIGACPGSPHTNFIGAALTLFDRHRAVPLSFSSALTSVVRRLMGRLILLPVRARIAVGIGGAFFVRDGDLSMWGPRSQAQE